MACRNEPSSELVRAVNESAEFQILIAHHARIRRTASFVLVGEVLNYLGLKLFGFVNEVIRNAQFVTNRTSVCDGLRAAALVFGTRDAVLGPEFQSDADNVVALFEQKRGSSRGIHSTA